MPATKAEGVTAIVLKRRRETVKALRAVPGPAKVVGVFALFALSWVVDLVFPYLMVGAWALMTGRTTAIDITLAVSQAQELVPVMSTIAIAYMMSFEPGFWTYVGQWQKPGK